jgi:hypothetical protein
MTCATFGAKRTPGRLRLMSNKSTRGNFGAGGWQSFRGPGWASIGQVVSEVSVEIHLVARLDARLRLVRLSGRGAEFRKTALVGRI